MNPKKQVDDGKKPIRLTSFTDTLKTEGLGWLLRRVRYRTPSTVSGRAGHRYFRVLLGYSLTLPRLWQKVFSKAYPSPPKLLFAFYDLQVSSVTYDVCWFAVEADRIKRQKGLDKIYFVIVPGLNEGLREERAAYEAVIDRVNRTWLLHNVVLPILTLVPSFSGFSLLPSRKSATSLLLEAGTAVYPLNYEPNLPISHHPYDLITQSKSTSEEIGILRSSNQGLRYINNWMAQHLSGQQLLTITLREYDFMPARNSNLMAWKEFATRLDTKIYLPVFVLDTERTLESLPNALVGFEVFSEASWNIGLRMALYESSYLNLGVNNGPLFMCLLNSLTRVLIFKMLTPSVPQTTEELMSKLGFDVGSQLPFTTPYQKLIWEEDSLETIEKEFFSMVDNIEQK